MKKRNSLIPVLFFAFVSFTIIGCSKSGGYGDGGNGGGGGGGGSNSATVYMRGSVFSSTSVTINTGGTVTWTNDDNMAHTVTANNGSFNSGNIPVNGTYSRTFTAAGSYPYHCTLHTGMTGTVVVVTN